MRSRLCGCALLLLSAGAVFGLRQGSQPKTATVTVGVSDSFGHPLSGCRIDKFVLLGDQSNTEYNRRFTGLVGRDIPFGDSYAVHVKCSDQNSGSSVTAVRRTDQFIKLTAGPLRGDYYTGSGPRLSVAIKTNAEFEIANDAWVELLALYGNAREIDRVQAPSHVAEFYDFAIVPGTYLVLIQNGDRASCVKRIEILGTDARLELSPASHTCTASGLSAVRIIE